MNRDVVIIGAGPAGATAAKVLVEQGIKVTLIDKHQFPREKPCGGGLPMKVLQRFPYINDLEVIMAYSHGGFLYAPSQHVQASTTKSSPSIAMVQRTSFDHSLLKLAQEAGAETIFGQTITSLSIEPHQVTLQAKNKLSFKAQICIGADGYPSIIGKKAGIVQQYPLTAACMYHEFQVTEKDIINWFGKHRPIHVHLKPMGISGYGWVFPKKDTVNIGIGDLWKPGQPYRPNLKKVFLEYLNLLVHQGLLKKPLQPKRISGGGLPLEPCAKTYTNRVLLCGDAAGFVNASSGEGIYYAMASGELAAQTVIEALEQENTQSSYLQRYQQLWMDDFGKDLRLMTKITKQWFDKSDQFVAQISKDPILSELCFDIMTGEKSVSQYKNKLMRRFLLTYLRRDKKKTNE